MTPTENKEDKIIYESDTKINTTGLNLERESKRLGVTPWIMTGSFILIMLLYVFGSQILQVFGFSPLSATLIVQWSILLVLPLLIAIISKEKLTDFFKLKAVPMVVYVKVFFAQLLIIPTIYIVNALSITVFTYFYKYVPLPIDTPTDFTQFMITFGLVSLTPGICEEFMFRGFLLSSVEKTQGRRKAAIIVAILFGLFHFTPQNIFGPIIMGLVFAYYVHVTGSIFPAMFGHLVNNGVAVVMMYISSMSTQGQSVEDFENMDLAISNLQNQGLLPIIILGIVILTILLIAYFALKFAIKIVKSQKNSFPIAVEKLDENGEKFIYFTHDYTVWKKESIPFGMPLFVVFAAVTAMYIYIFYLTYIYHV